MTDAEIVRACGEAMGWHWDICVPSEVGEFRHYAYAWTSDDGLFVAPPDWDPLTSDTACMQVLDEFAKQGLRPNLGFGPTIGPSDCWYMEWMPIGESYMVGVHFPSTPEGRRRAVCVGFLKAKGRWRAEK